MARTAASQTPPAGPDASCPQCGGSGIIAVSDLDVVPCSCGLLQQDMAASRLARARIPARFARRSLDSYEAPKGDKIRQEVKKTAKAYAMSFDPTKENGLRLHGSIGSGKTHIAVGILKEVIARGYTGLYYNFSDLLEDLKASFDPESPTEGWEILEEVDTADLLVLDDIGAESPTDWVKDRLYLIINRRYESDRALIITTNCTVDVLRTRMGQRTFSRLMEMCDEFPPFPQEDWRLKKLQ